MMDGRADDRKELRREARLNRRNGTSLIAVGLGVSRDNKDAMTDLGCIAGSSPRGEEKRLYLTHGYDDLPSLRQTIFDILCNSV